MSANLDLDDSGHSFKTICERFDALFNQDTPFDYNRFHDDLDDTINDIISQNDNSSKEILNACEQLLQIFISSNWTGPTSECNLLLKSQKDRKEILALFSPDDDVFPTVRCPEILFIAQECLKILRCKSSEGELLYVRSLFLLQQILEDIKSDIYDEIIKYVENIQQNNAKNFDSPTKQVEFFIEASIIFIHLNDFGRSKEFLEKAKKTLGCDIILSGALGKRTQHQQNCIPQLIAIYKDNNDDVIFQHSTTVDSPSNMKLEDDVCLEGIEYLDKNTIQMNSISPIKQALILANSLYISKAGPLDELRCEEVIPFLNLVLSRPTCWPLHFSSLLQRSLMEKGSSRRIERSMKQLTELIESTVRNQPTFCERYLYFYVSGIPPKWKIQQALAQLLMRLGAVKSALEIYLSLEDWPNVFGCYYELDLKNKAEEVARMLLNKDNSVNNWCLLGDATDDPNCYLHAWELSNGRSSRAQKSLGLLKFKRKQFDECKTHLQKSLSLNRSQLRVWYYYGFCCLETEDWQNAASAYRQCTCLDPDNFEAWNNLSKAYIKLGQKVRAVKTLEEALRCDYENWKIWENYILCCIDCGYIQEVINAYHRLLDLKPQYYDEEVLRILIHSIGTSDAKGPSYQSTLKSACTLMGRVSSLTPKQSEMWYLYGELLGFTHGDCVHVEKQMQCYQKSLSVCVQESNWEKDADKCVMIMKRIINILKILENCNSTAAVIKQIKASTKYSTKSLLALIKKNHESLDTGELPVKLSHLYCEVSDRAKELE